MGPWTAIPGLSSAQADVKSLEARVPLSRQTGAADHGSPVGCSEMCSCLETGHASPEQAKAFPDDISPEQKRFLL